MGDDVRSGRRPIVDLSDEEARLKLPLKWGVPHDVVPAWVAEMDYAVDPVVLGAVQQALHGHPAGQTGHGVVVGGTEDDQVGPRPLGRLVEAARHRAVQERQLLGPGVGDPLRPGLAEHPDVRVGGRAAGLEDQVQGRLVAEPEAHVRAELTTYGHGLGVVVAVHVGNQEPGDVGQPAAELGERLLEQGS